MPVVTKHNLFLVAGFNSDERKNFLLEMDVMKMIPPHPNVIALIGGNINRGNIYTLLAVFFYSGDLHDHHTHSTDSCNHGQNQSLRCNYHCSIS